MRSSETDFFFEKTGVEKLFAHTSKNTLISPNFLVCNSPKTMPKLRLSTKLTQSFTALGEITVFFTVPPAKVLLKNFEPIKS